MAKANGKSRRRKLILACLHLAQKTQAGVAREVGVSRGLVCHVIAGRKSHKGVQKALARVCGMTFSELWED